MKEQLANMTIIELVRTAHSYATSIQQIDTYSAIVTEMAARLEALNLAHIAAMNSVRSATSTNDNLAAECAALKASLTRNRHNWPDSVMRTCDHCGQWKMTVIGNDAMTICASCCDAEYESDLASNLELAIEALEAAQNRVAELENDEVRQRLANAEHQLYMAELAKQNLRASRKAQFRERKAAEKRISELEREKDYIRKRYQELDLLIGKNILVMQAAIIDWQATGDAKNGLAWIYNTLFGPGELPDEAEKDAQAYFDRKYAPLDEEIMKLHQWFWVQSEAERAAAIKLQIEVE